MKQRTVYRKIRNQGGRNFIELNSKRIYFNEMGVLPTDIKIGKDIFKDYRAFDGVEPGKIISVSLWGSRR